MNFKSLPGENLSLNETEKEALKIWEEFLINFPEPEMLPSYPLWTMEFGANYEFEKYTPFYSSKEDLVGRKGVFGEKIPNLSKEDILKRYIPRYATTQQEIFPS